LSEATLSIIAGIAVTGIKTHCMVTFCYPDRPTNGSADAE